MTEKLQPLEILNIKKETVYDKGVAPVNEGVLLDDGPIFGVFDGATSPASPTEMKMVERERPLLRRLSVKFFLLKPLRS